MKTDKTTKIKPLTFFLYKSTDKFDLKHTR